MYKVALITGASAGIGKVFAEILAKRGYQSLILVARRTDRLETLKRELVGNGFKGAIHIFTCDLRVEAERERLKQAVDATSAPVDLLINNAGFGYVGKFLVDDAKNQRDMVETNWNRQALSRSLI